MGGGGMLDLSVILHSTTGSYCQWLWGEEGVNDGYIIHSSLYIKILHDYGEVGEGGIQHLSNWAQKGGGCAGVKPVHRQNISV